MALKKIYFGSVGPFLYDDADPVNDPDGDFAGEDHKSIITDGQLLVEQGPTADEEVIRLIDLGYRLLPPVSVVNIDNPTELNTLAGDIGALVLVYQIVGAAGLNEYTIYAYDASGPAVNAPYIMDAQGAGAERWIAIAGKYSIVDTHISGNITITGTVDGIDISVHAANANAHHAQAHLISSHTDTNLGAIANNDLWRWDDPSSKWLPKSIQEVILSQSINPGSANIGNVGAGNYTEIKIDGEVNLHGTARVIRHLRVGAASWKPGGAAPSAGFIGVFATLDFDAVSDDEIHYTLIVPHRWDSAVDIEFATDWLYSGAPDAGTVCWGLEYKSIKAGEVVAGAGITITKVSAGGHTSGQMVRTTFTTKILATNLEAGDTLGFRLYRDVSADTLAVVASLINTHFHFTMNKLGLAT